MISKEELSVLLEKLKSGQANSQDKSAIAGAIASGRFDDFLRDLVHHDFLESFLEELREWPEGFEAEAIFEKIIAEDKAPTPRIISLSRRWMPYLTAAMIIIALGVGWSLRQTKNNPLSEILDRNKTTISIATDQQKKWISLPDGSSVILNSHSSLIYEEEFKSGRRVELTGEAYFEIEKDPSRPFTVQTGKVVTRVLGTAFNVNTKSEKIEVTVVHGLVEVGDDSKVYSKIRPSERIEVNKTTLDYKLGKLSTEASELAWQRKMVVIDEMTFEDALTLLSRKFQARIELENQALKTCRISANFVNGESLDEILLLISASYQAEVKKEKTRYLIFGGIPCDPLSNNPVDKK